MKKKSRESNLTQNKTILMFDNDLQKLLAYENDDNTHVAVVFHKVIKDSDKKYRVIVVTRMGHDTHRPSLIASLAKNPPSRLYCINGYEWNPKTGGKGYRSFKPTYHSDWGTGVDYFDYEVGKLIRNKSRWNSDYYSYNKPPKGYKLKYIVE